MINLWGKFANGRVYHAIGQWGYAICDAQGEWPMTVFRSVSKGEICKHCLRRVKV